MISQKIIKEVSKDLDLPEDIVSTAYMAYWRFIRDTIAELPLKNCTEDEFNKLSTSFNIPSLGKLYCTFDKWKSLKERYKKTFKNK